MLSDSDNFFANPKSDDFQTHSDSDLDSAYVLECPRSPFIAISR